MKFSEIVRLIRNIFSCFERKFVSGPFIVQEKNFEVLSIGTKEQAVEKAIGKGEIDSEYDDCYFKSHKELGVQIRYSSKEKKMQDIFYYNNEAGKEDYSIASVSTDKGVSWGWSVEMVMKAYGKPPVDYSGENWRRISYEGMSFRWLNGQLVSISVPGDPLIVAGVGYGRIKVGETKEVVEQDLLKMDRRKKTYDDVCFVSYPSDGLEISYDTVTGKVVAIFFYNNMRGYNGYEAHHAITQKGIGWGATIEMVTSAYGNPKFDYSKGDLRRLAFDGIDFIWECGRLVRMGIPGK